MTDSTTTRARPETTKMTAAEAVDFLSVWGETELKKAEPQTTGPDGHEWAKTEAGYEFVQSMIPRAYDKANLMWFGWALREAFVAGAEWQEKRDGS